MSSEVDSDFQTTNTELSTALWSPDPSLPVVESQLDDFPTEDSEMSFFDHLEELRQRIFYGIIAVAIGALGCFIYAKQIVQVLEIPAAGIKFLQLAPGEYFFCLGEGGWLLWFISRQSSSALSGDSICDSWVDAARTAIGVTCRDCLVGVICRRHCLCLLSAHPRRAQFFDRLWC